MQFPSPWCPPPQLSWHLLKRSPFFSVDGFPLYIHLCDSFSTPPISFYILKNSIYIKKNSSPLHLCFLCVFNFPCLLPISVCIPLPPHFLLFKCVCLSSPLSHLLSFFSLFKNSPPFSCFPICAYVIYFCGVLLCPISCESHEPKRLECLLGGGGVEILTGSLCWFLS